MIGKLQEKVASQLREHAVLLLSALLFFYYITFLSDEFFFWEFAYAAKWGLFYAIAGATVFALPKIAREMPISIKPSLKSPGAWLLLFGLWSVLGAAFAINQEEAFLKSLNLVLLFVVGFVFAPFALEKEEKVFRLMEFFAGITLLFVAITLASPLITGEAKAFAFVTVFENLDNAGLLVMVTALLFLSAAEKGSKSFFYNAMLFCAIGLIVVHHIRSVMLASAIAIIIFMAKAFNKKQFAAIAASAAAFTAAFISVTSKTLGEFFIKHSGFMAQRGLYWAKGIEVFLYQPLFGIGVGAGTKYLQPLAEQGAITESKRIFFGDPSLQFANAFVSALAETGLVGFLLVMLFSVSAIVVLAKAIIKFKGEGKREIAMLSFAAFGIGFMVYSLFETTITVAGNVAMLWLVVVLGIVVKWQRDNSAGVRQKGG